MEFLYYLLQVSGCITLFYIIYHLLLRKETFSQLNRFYLLFGAVLSLFIPVLPQFIDASLAPQWANEGVFIFLELPETTPNTITSEGENLNNSPLLTTFLTLENGLLLLYGIGAMILFIKLVMNLLKVAWQIKTSEVIKKGDYYLVKSHQPLVCSFWNYLFWNEHLEFTPSEKRQILEHELIHIREKHTLDLLFLEGLTILLWFNPFIYLYKTATKNIHEYIADSFVFYDLNYTTNYAQLLIKEATLHITPSPVTHTFFNSLTKNRLIMLSQVTHPFKKLKLLAVLPMMVLLLIVFGVRPSATAQAESTNPIFNAKPGQIIFQKDGSNKRNFHADGTRLTDEELKDVLIKEYKENENRVIKREDILLVTTAQMNEVNGITPESKETLVLEKNRVKLVWSGVKAGKLQDLRKPEHQRFKLIDTKTNTEIKVISYSIIITILEKENPEKYGNMNYYKYNYKISSKNRFFAKDLLFDMQSLVATDHIRMFDFKFELDGKLYVAKDLFKFVIK